MPFLLIIIIVVSFVMYFFYKVKQIRSKRPYEKRFLNSKATISLGILLVSYGINQLLHNPSTTELVIGLLFTLLGTIYTITSYKSYRHFLPLASNEVEEGKK